MLFYLFLFIQYVLAKPNVLFIISDDLSQITSEYVTKEHPLFPKYNAEDFYNMEKTVYNGITPISVCGPARASILTGLSPDNSKILNFETYINNITLPSYLKNKLNYNTVIFGKVYHTSPLSEINTQIEYKMGDISSPIFNIKSDNGVCGKNVYCQKPIYTLTDYKTVNLFENFLKKNNKPWAAFIGFKKPHIGMSYPILIKNIDNVNYTIPKINNIEYVKTLSYIDFDGSKLKLNFNGKWESIIYKNRRFTYNIFENKQTIKLLRQAYYSSVSYILTLTNKVIKLLKKYRYYDNTIIIFTSDNGWANGEELQLGKNGLNKIKRRVPLIIRTPTHKKIYYNKYPTSTINIFCTIIDLIDKNIDSNLNCKSLVPSLYNEDIDIDQGTISQYPRCNDLFDIQKDDCMNSIGICKRNTIKYMGYSLEIRDPIKKGIFIYNAWWPYKEIRTKCDYNILGGIIYGTKVWKMSKLSGTQWDKPSIQQELYFYKDNVKVGSADYYSLNNLYNYPEYKQLIYKFEKIIKLKNNF